MLDHHIRNYIAAKLADVGISSDPYGIELTSVFVLAVLAIAAVSYLVVHHVIVRSVKNVLQKTINRWLIVSPSMTYWEKYHCWFR